MEYNKAIHFNFCITSGFGSHFDFFLFKPFFYQKWLSKCTNDAYFRSQEVKTHQIGYFIWKNSFNCKEWHFGGHFVFYYPIFLPEVDDLENWAAIPNLVMSNTTYIPNFKKIGLKLWLWQCAWVFDKNGGRDVIN